MNKTESISWNFSESVSLFPPGNFPQFPALSLPELSLETVILQAGDSLEACRLGKLPAWF